MLKWIISANYRDRQSPFKWLVRCSTQKPEEAIAYKLVRATNVVFCSSTEYEKGFGCAIIAQAEDVTVEGREGMTTLTFSGDKFFDEKGKALPEVAELHLAENGSMSALPKV